MRPLQVLAVFAGVSAAFSWQGALEDSAAKAVQGIENVERLFRRQQTTTGTTSTSNTQTTTAETTAKTTGSTTGKVTGSVTGKTTGTAKSGSSGTITASAAATSAVDPRDPAGGVSMITPDLFAGAQYYKIGDWVTFAWNFTSVINKPSAINVYATCSSASAQWTLAANVSYEPTQTVLWDTNQYSSRATPQLIMATYTLLIENADEAKATALSNPGEIGTINQFTFGMYSPQPSVGLSDFTCATCNAATSGNQRQALGFVFAMVAVTILSFTWFTTGAFSLL